MFGSEALGVAIGLVFIYFLLSLLCSAINEVIAQIVGLRSRTLLVGIRTLIADVQIARAINPRWNPFAAARKLFSAKNTAAPARTDSPLTQLLYAHPLINGLYKQELLVFNGGLPSYIPAETFARALLHSLTEQVSPSIPIDGIVAEVNNLGERRLADAKPALIGGLLARLAERGGRLPLSEVEAAINLLPTTLLADQERTAVLADLNQRATQPVGTIGQAVTFGDVKNAVEAALRKAALDKIIPEIRNLTLTEVEAAIGQVATNVLTEAERTALLADLQEHATNVAGTTSLLLCTADITDALSKLPRPPGDTAWQQTAFDAIAGTLRQDFTAEQAKPAIDALPDSVLTDPEKAALVADLQERATQPAARMLTRADIDAALGTLQQHLPWRQTAVNKIVAALPVEQQDFEHSAIASAVSGLAGTVLTPAERTAITDKLQQRARLPVGNGTRKLSRTVIAEVIDELPWRSAWRQDRLVAITLAIPTGRLSLAFTDIADATGALEGLAETDKAALLKHLAEYAVHYAGRTRPRSLTYADAVQAINALPDALYGDLKRALLALMGNVQADIAHLEKAVADWFDDAMERVSGWYKRRVQLILLVIGLIVAIAMNADSITLATALWRDPTLRAAVEAAAQQAVARAATATVGAVASPTTAATAVSTPTATATSGVAGTTTPSPPPTATPSYPITQIGAIQQELDSLMLPVGWGWGAEVPKGDPRDLPDGPIGWLLKIGGLLVTTLALSLGAPFWFQVLSKLVNPRASGEPPKEPKEKEPKA